MKNIKDNVNKILDPIGFLPEVLITLKNTYKESWIIVAYNNILDTLGKELDRETYNVWRFVDEIKDLLSDKNFLNYLDEIDNIENIVNSNPQITWDLYDLLVERAGWIQNEEKWILEWLDTDNKMNILVKKLKEEWFDDINNPNDNKKS